jgi:hypothetical protein
LFYYFRTFFLKQLLAACFIHTANSAHAKERVSKHPGTISKKNLKYYFFCVALSRGCDQPQSRLRHVREEWNHGSSVATFFSRLPPRSTWPFAAAAR